MATLFDGTLVCSNSTNAQFRAWGAYIHAVAILGLVNTADTGQIDFTTVLAPGLANTKMGYKIYRMDDALQATAPVFIRIDFGSGTAATTPGIWITIGTGTDGAGTITGTLYNGGGSATANMSTASVLGVRNSYGSSEDNRLSLGMFCTVTANIGWAFSLERSKDSSGDDTADGFILVYGSAGVVNFSTYIKYTGPQPPADSGINALLPTANPGSFGSDIGIGIHIPFAGIAQYPGVGICSVRQADFAAEAGFTMTIYGSVRTYQQLNNTTARFPMSTTADTNSRVCIIYE